MNLFFYCALRFVEYLKYTVFDSFWIFFLLFFLNILPFGNVYLIYSISVNDNSLCRFLNHVIINESAAIFVGDELNSLETNADSFRGLQKLFLEDSENEEDISPVGISDESLMVQEYECNDNHSISVLLEEKRILIVTFPKLGSLSLIKWGMAVSGFKDKYGIDINLPSIFYDPKDPYGILQRQPNLTSEFFQDYCKETQSDWHNLFHDAQCPINLYNHAFSDIINSLCYQKYVVIRDIYDRLITAYMNHYEGVKIELYDNKYISLDDEFSFKELLNFLVAGYNNHHFLPYSRMIPFEMKEKINSFKIINFENLVVEVDKLCRKHQISILMSEIPNDHKNRLFGSTLYLQIYDLPKPHMNEGAPDRDPKYWFDKQMKEQVLYLFKEDFSLFKSALQPME